MESQLDKLGRNLKSDEYWTLTTIYRPSRRNQSELCVYLKYCTKILHCLASKHAAVTSSRRPLNSGHVTFDFAIYLCSQNVQ